MNYLKIYVKLVKKARDREIYCQAYEKHHVFPKSIYGKNNYIVKLTPREHYIAHALLCKIFIKRYGTKDKKSVKMIRAFWFMHSNSPRQSKRYVNSRMYEILKTLHKKSMAGENNPMHNVRITGRTHSKETKKIISKKIKKWLIINGNPMLGRKHSPESLKKMKEAKLGDKNPMFKKTHSEEARQKIREAKLGEKHHLFGKPPEETPFFGRTHTDEAKKIMSEKKSRSNIGRKWWTDGKNNVFKKECPDGFYAGRIYVRKTNKS
jgi:hypothetical protein